MKAIAFILIAFTCGSAAAQTCANLQIKKGTEYVTLREIDPAQPKDAAYFKMNEKKRKQMDDIWAGLVASGQAAPMKDTVIVKMTDIQPSGAGSNYSATVYSKGVGYDVNYTCANDKLYMYPYKKVTVTPTQTSDGKPFTLTTYSGTNIIPLNLKVGDTLPSYQNYSISSDYTKEWTAERKYEYTDVMGTDWIVTEHIPQHVTVSSTIVTKYCNREVLGQEDYTFNGKTYKAFKIITEIWIKNETNTETNSMVAALVANISQKAVNRKVAKLIPTNQQGYTVSYQLDWFVPELGLGKSEIYDANGGLMVKMTTVGTR